MFDFIFFAVVQGTLKPFLLPIGFVFHLGPENQSVWAFLTWKPLLTKANTYTCFTVHCTERRDYSWQIWTAVLWATLHVTPLRSHGLGASAPPVAPLWLGRRVPFTWRSGRLSGRQTGNQCSAPLSLCWGDHPSESVCHEMASCCCRIHRTGPNTGFVAFDPIGVDTI